MKSLVKKVMKLLYWLRKRKEFPSPKKLSLHNIFNYLEAEVNHWKSTSKFLDCPKDIEEQSVWRLNKIATKSPECLKNGACKLCGCDIIDKSFEKDGCEGGCYPERMNKSQWEIYKQQNNIEDVKF